MIGITKCLFGTRDRVALFAVACAFWSGVSQGQDSAPSSAPRPRNNLMHPPDTNVANWDSFGHIAKRGSGSTNLVLLPAGGWGAASYEPFLQRSLDRYTIFSVTPPGYAGTMPYPMTDDDGFHELIWCKSIQRAILKLLKTNDLHRPFLMGHGFIGDYHALRFALDHPELISGVIIVAGTPILPFAKANATSEQRRRHVLTNVVSLYKTQTQSEWERGLMPPAMLSVDTDRGKTLFEELRQVPIPTMLHYFLEVCTTDLGPELANLHVPALVIEPVPKELTGYPESIRKQWKARNPWIGHAKESSLIQMEFVPNSGRFVMDDRPAIFDSLVQDFVSAHGSR